MRSFVERLWHCSCRITWRNIPSAPGNGSPAPATTRIGAILRLLYAERTCSTGLVSMAGRGMAGTIGAEGGLTTA
jgi:hypothetical protein